jgi:hypothetical protein
MTRTEPVTEIPLHCFSTAVQQAAAWTHCAAEQPAVAARPLPQRCRQLAPPRGRPPAVRLVIEAPWLVNGGHGASLRHHNAASPTRLVIIEARWGSKPLAFVGQLQPQRLIKWPKPCWTDSPLLLRVVVVVTLCAPTAAAAAAAAAHAPPFLSGQPTKPSHPRRRSRGRREGRTGGRAVHGAAGAAMRRTAAQNITNCS